MHSGGSLVTIAEGYVVEKNRRGGTIKEYHGDLNPILTFRLRFTHFSISSSRILLGSAWVGSGFYCKPLVLKAPWMARWQAQDVTFAGVLIDHNFSQQCTFARSATKKEAKHTFHLHPQPTFLTQR